ncbi:RNA-directed DNA polymerase from mobile element jockey [Trichonephila clavipes]|nr:RNA-directed DNA polymerase from mobile element jockey [Trichonephila clavipes]
MKILTEYWVANVESLKSIVLTLHFEAIRWLRLPSGQGIGSWQACHELSTTKDPPCRAAMHVSAVPDYCQLTGTLPPLLDSGVGGGTPGRNYVRVLMDPNILCPGKGLVLPTTLNIEQTASTARFFILSLPNNEMSKKSPSAIFKALQAIGEPKSVKKMHSGDLLVETQSNIQSKSHLSAKTFLDSPLLVIPHKSLNTCRGVISEPDLLCTSDAEILEGFSDQGVVQVRRITLKKDAVIIPTKHIILTFNSPKLPTTIKAGYLNCKIRPYIPNPLRCFKCQRFGHSQTSCRGQLTCSRCASVGHSSTDCTLEPKCINCSQLHSADSKLCPKCKIEKQIQEIKTNKNIFYFEARKLIVPQLTQTYAQALKPSTIFTTTQTDPNVTNIICPPLQCLKPVPSKSPMPSTTSSVSTVSTSSSSTQENLLTSPSAEIPTIQSGSLLKIPIPTTTTSPGNNLNTSVSSLETETRSLTNPDKFNALSTETLPESVLTTSNSEHSNAPEIPQCIKRNSRNRRKRPKVQKPEIEIKMTPHRPRNAASIEYATDDEDMITYDVEEEET